MENEFADTVTWLQSLGDIAAAIQQYRFEGEPAEEEVFVKAARAVDYLRQVNDDLPQLRETLMSKSHGGTEVAPERAEALKRFQCALVDVARAIIHVYQRGSADARSIPFPPYDQWLPFKDGIGAH